jgi:hypothetical protein
MTHQRVIINDLLGTPTSDIAVVPPVYIHNVISKMRELPALSLTEIYAAMVRAAEIYQYNTIAGLSANDYCQLVQRTTGLPLDVLQNSLSTIADALKKMPETITASMPQGARLLWHDPDSLMGCSLFSRKGDIFTVLAAGNGPGIHALWPQAVALGYRTLVKPSSREPFTAQRIVQAMEMAGLGNYVALIPTDYRGVDELITSSDLTLAYGDQDIVEKYHNHPKVRVQGPGRSKIVIGADVDRKEAVSLVVKSMTDLGGAACVSTSAVLVESGVTEFCQHLKQALQQLPQHMLPCGSAQMVERLNHTFENNNEIPIETTLTSRGYVLSPIVTEVTEPDDPRIQRELPFPYVTVAPYHSIRSAPMLADSLVVTVFSQNSRLLEPILKDASIRNVYIGDIPTSWMSPLVPHDGYLSEFLMCNRGLRTSVSWS